VPVTWMDADSGIKKREDAIYGRFRTPESGRSMPFPSSSCRGSRCFLWYPKRRKVKYHLTSIWDRHLVGSMREGGTLVHFEGNRVCIPMYYGCMFLGFDDILWKGYYAVRKRNSTAMVLTPNRQVCFSFHLERVDLSSQKVAPVQYWCCFRV
jgi:hypothetical protein